MSKIVSHKIISLVASMRKILLELQRSGYTDPKIAPLLEHFAAIDDEFARSDEHARPMMDLYEVFPFVLTFMMLIPEKMTIDLTEFLHVLFLEPLTCADIDFPEYNDRLAEGDIDAAQSKDGEDWNAYKKSLAAILIAIVGTTPRAIAAAFALHEALNKTCLGKYSAVRILQKVLTQHLAVGLTVVLSGDYQAVHRLFYSLPNLEQFIEPEASALRITDFFGDELPLATHLRCFQANHPDPLVGVVMGSTSDLELISPALATLQKLHIPFRVDVLSAHRTVERITPYVEGIKKIGVKCVIAGAGGAAALPGALAGHFPGLPIIGLPIRQATTSLDGTEALLAITQMPPGVPVAAVGINGAENAALQAANILAPFYPQIAAKLHEHNEQTRLKARDQSVEIKERGWSGTLDFIRANQAAAAEQQRIGNKRTQMTSAADRRTVTPFPKLAAKNNDEVTDHSKKRRYT